MMRRSEDWVRLGAFAIFAMLFVAAVTMLVTIAGVRAAAMMLGIGCVAGLGYWRWCVRREGQVKKREAPSAEYDHNLTREERQDLNKKMLELEEQLKKPAKRKPP